MHHGGVDDSIAAGPGERLPDGWDPDTPDSDTWVRAAVAVHADWVVSAAEAKGRPWRRTDRWVGAWAGDRGELTNAVMPLRPSTGPDWWADVLGEAADLVPASSPYLLLSPFPTPDLSRHGLARVGHPPLMLRPPGPGPQAGRPGEDVREVSDPDDLAAAERVLVTGYPMPEMEPLVPGDVLPAALLTSGTRVWTAHVDGAPVAVAVAHATAHATLVAYVATLATARGSGAGSAVTWAATLSRPDLPALLVASDDGRPVYERLGYLAIERWTAWLRPGT